MILFRKKTFKILIEYCSIEYGHLEILKWGLEEGFFNPTNCIPCNLAARYGKLKILKWLRCNGFPWHEYVCSNAAHKGHFELLKWAQQNGCPWNERTSYFAQRSGHQEIYDWAVENGCPTSDDYLINIFGR